MERIHKPVMLRELRDLLNLKAGDTVIDATLDGGGHAEMLLEKVGERGKVLGIDQDEEILKLWEVEPPIRGSTSKNLVLALGNFRNIDMLANKFGFAGVNAILFDLGLSTWHLKASGRGFSYQKSEEPLLMGFSGEKMTASEVLNRADEKELAEILEKYGELKNTRNLAQSIIAQRRGKRIISVKDFLGAIPIKDKKKLAKVFQALRIYVNDELGALAEALPKSFDLLFGSGMLAVISYHSLEDGLVKRFFLQKKREGSARILAKKPITPSKEERESNPSSRSAKLRILVKI